MKYLLYTVVKWYKGRRTQGFIVDGLFSSRGDIELLYCFTELLNKTQQTEGCKSFPRWCFPQKCCIYQMLIWVSLFLESNNKSKRS